MAGSRICPSIEYAVGDFFGETAILLGTQSLVSLRAETQTRVARLEQQEFQNLIRDSKEASAMILQTMNDRLMRVQKYATTVPSSRVLILGTKYDTDCRDIRAFLASNRIPSSLSTGNRSRGGFPRSCVRIGLSRGGGRWKAF